MIEPYNRKPQALAHAERLAEAVDLDMVAAGWRPTAENYLGRVTKARILGAVREAKGDQAAQLIDHLKKVEMAEKAEGLLTGSGWLPEPLRTPGRDLARFADAKPASTDQAVESDSADTEPTTKVACFRAADAGETLAGETGVVGEDDEAEDDTPHAIAAE